MTRHNTTLGFRCAFAFGALAVTTPAMADTQSANGRGIVLNALSVTNTRDLDFGDLSSGVTTGRATVNANTDVLTITGGITPLGGTPNAAVFYAAGTINRLFIVQIPSGSITLTNGSGGTMTVSNWTSNGPVNRNLGPTGVAIIRVGGRLNVGANQAGGTYSGTFTVTVVYP